MRLKGSGLLPTKLIPPFCRPNPPLRTTGLRCNEKLRYRSWRYKQVFLPVLTGLQPSTKHVSDAGTWTCPLPAGPSSSSFITLLQQPKRCPPRGPDPSTLRPVIVTLYEKRPFADVIMDLEMGRLSWVGNDKCPCKTGTEGDLALKKAMRPGVRDGKLRAGSHRCWKSAPHPPPELPEGAQPAPPGGTLISAQAHFLPSGLHDCDRTHFCHQVYDHL